MHLLPRLHRLRFACVCASRGRLADTIRLSMQERLVGYLAYTSVLCYSRNMKLNGNYRFDVPRERLWDALMDSGVVSQCVPGVHSFTAVGPDRYEIEIALKVGVVLDTYKGTLELADKDAPVSYRMIVQGSGPRTNMKGEGSITLESLEDGATTLTFDGVVQVTGVLARVGQRLMTTVARGRINRFFECLISKTVQP